MPSSLPEIRGDPVWTFGAYDVPIDRVIGRVVDADWLPGIGYVVLDGQQSQVLVIREDGVVAHRFGGPGLGPGEFVDARALAVGPAGTVWVLDGRQRLQTFRIGPSSAELIHEVTVRVTAPMDLCAIGDRVVLAGLSGGEPDLIHILADDGDVEESFGMRYRSGWEAVSLSMSQGRVTCDSEGVALAMRLYGEVYRFSPAGTLEWVHELRPYNGTMNRSHVRERRYQSGLMGGLVEKGHVLAGVTKIGSTLVVQLGLETLSSKTQKLPYARLDTYLLDPRTGQGTFVGSDQPLFLAQGRRSVLTYSEAPWPRLEAVATKP